MVIIVKVTVGQPQSLLHGYYSKSNGRPASVVRTWLLVKVTVGPASVVRTWLL